MQRASVVPLVARKLQPETVGQMKIGLEVQEQLLQGFVAAAAKELERQMKERPRWI